jgi:hypothetical protein
MMPSEEAALIWSQWERQALDRVRNDLAQGQLGEAFNGSFTMAHDAACTIPEPVQSSAR